MQRGFKTAAGRVSRARSGVCGLMSARRFAGMAASQVETSWEAVPIEYRQAPTDSKYGQFRREDMLQVSWEGDFGVPSGEFVIDCSAGTAEEQVALGRAAFEKHGIVLFDKTGLTEAEDMAALARQVLPDEMVYEGGSNARNPTGVAKNVYDVGAPLSARLHYHTEMAYVLESTTALAFLAIDTVEPAVRGATYVSNKKEVTKALLGTELGQELRRRGVCYQRDLTDGRQYGKGRVEEGVYNHWQQSFMTDSAEEAEAKARAKGLQVRWAADGLMETRLYTEAYEYCPATDANLLYSSIADHGSWFDEWPLVGHLPMDKRPLRMTFGDDTPFTRAQLQQFADVHSDHGMPLAWERGQVAVICNRRIAHGRPGIHLRPGETRRLGVILGGMYARQGTREDKWW